MRETCVLNSSRADSEKILNRGDTNLLLPNIGQRDHIESLAATEGRAYIQ